MSKVLPLKSIIHFSIDSVDRLVQIRRLYRKYSLRAPTLNQIVNGAILSIKISELEHEIQRMSALDNK